MSLGNNIYDALGEKGHPYQSTSAKMGKSGKALLIRYSRNLLITLQALGYNHMKQSKKTLLLKKRSHRINGCQLELLLPSKKKCNEYLNQSFSSLHIWSYLVAISG